MKFKKFLNSSYGSYFKVFASTILTLYLTQGADLFAMDLNTLKTFINAGIASLIPVILNAWNSEDKRYGKKIDQLKKDTSRI